MFRFHIHNRDKFVFFSLRYFFCSSENVEPSDANNVCVCLAVCQTSSISHSPGLLSFVDNIFIFYPTYWWISANFEKIGYLFASFFHLNCDVAAVVVSLLHCQPSQHYPNTIHNLNESHWTLLRDFCELVNHVIVYGDHKPFRQINLWQQLKNDLADPILCIGWQEGRNAWYSNINEMNDACKQYIMTTGLGVPARSSCQSSGLLGGNKPSNNTKCQRGVKLSLNSNLHLFYEHTI